MYYPHVIPHIVHFAGVPVLQFVVPVFFHQGTTFWHSIEAFQDTVFNGRSSSIC